MSSKLPPIGRPACEQHEKNRGSALPWHLGTSPQRDSWASRFSRLLQAYLEGLPSCSLPRHGTHLHSRSRIDRTPNLVREFPAIHANEPTSRRICETPSSPPPPPCVVSHASILAQSTTNQSIWPTGLAVVVFPLPVRVSSRTVPALCHLSPGECLYPNPNSTTSNPTFLPVFNSCQDLVLSCAY